jgi:lambda repressor-like predicted transcriptional regulator
MKNELLEEYVEKIEPILPLAKRAFGSRNQSTPQHDASREYTRLLKEFHLRGGSLSDLSKRLGVAYAGLRRRVIMNDVSVSEIRPKIRVKDQDIKAAANRVREAKAHSVTSYHDQLAEEYRNGISLSNLAKELGLSSAAPLYYGVQRSIQRNG